MYEPDASKLKCNPLAGIAKNMCDDRQIWSKKRSKCIDCFPYTRAQKGGKVCAADRCIDGIIKFNGTCKACPPGQGPDDWGRKCIPKVESL